MNNASSGSSLPEADRADMDVFIERMIQLLPVLGIHHFSAPVAMIRKPVQTNNQTPLDLPSASKNVQMLSFTVKGVVATGTLSEAGFTVFRNSCAVLKMTPSCPPVTQRYRSKMLEQGVLVQNDNHYCFTEDYEFSSPSAAGAVVSGRSTNGLTAWKTDAGVELKDLMKA